MDTQRNLAVIHFSNEEYEQALKMQNRIRQALSRGRNVVLICDTPMMRRMERLTFACLSVRNAPGRFAIVTQDVSLNRFPQCWRIACRCSRLNMTPSIGLILIRRTRTRR